VALWGVVALYILVSRLGFHSYLGLVSCLPIMVVVNNRDLCSGSGGILSTLHEHSFLAWVSWWCFVEGGLSPSVVVAMIY
jgi:hypothetical protein